LTKAQIAMALLRNIDPTKFPEGLDLKGLLTKFDKQSGASMSGKDYGTGAERKKDEWLFLFVAGMWFQDLFNYDFRRTEMCIIPYATQLGEISFCAYNTGIGWRKIIENMYKTASVAEWNKKHGKHAVFAGGHDVPLEDVKHSLVLNAQDVTRVRHLDEELAHTAADEERMARAKTREAEKMKRMMDELTYGRNLGGNEAGELVKIELAQRKAETVSK
jgi:hypothetical protein